MCRKGLLRTLRGDAAMIESYDYSRRTGVRELDWETCSDLTGGLAEALQSLGIDAVVGIARAGLIPATMIALSLRREMFPIRLSRRVNDEVKYDSPVWWIRVPPDVVGLRVAVVDEIADSGETLESTRQAVVEAGASEVVTAALVQHSWADPTPTFAGLMSDELIIFPWNRVLERGRWRLHPELQSALPALGG
jgi:hypoxanthine phosphoribosyltransferase